MVSSSVRCLPARRTNGRLHIVITTQAIQLAITLLALCTQCFPGRGGVTQAHQLPPKRVSFLLALGTVEMFGMNHLELVDDVIPLDGQTGHNVHTPCNHVKTTCGQIYLHF